jgi:peptide-methionine (R)-S-oxide reductase
MAGSVSRTLRAVNQCEKTARVRSACRLAPARGAFENARKEAEPMKPAKVIKSDEQWRKQLTPEQYAVTRQQGTEAPFGGCYWNNKEAGTYHCVCCDLPLFASGEKYDSGTGWPSFATPIDPARLTLREDRGHGMVRTEVLCAACDAHLGHVFPDGPPPTGQRYCMNSVALRHEPKA